MKSYIALDPLLKHAHNYYQGHRINVHTGNHTELPGDNTTQAASMNSIHSINQSINLYSPPPTVAQENIHNKIS